MNSIEAVAWNHPKVRLLDQRALPHQESYIELSSAEETAQAITDMVVRGAPAIGCCAAYGLAAEAFRLQQAGTLSWESLQQAGEKLIAARPTAINLAWAVKRMLSIPAHKKDDELANRLLAEAETIAEEDRTSCRTMGSWGAAILPKKTKRPLYILTHCNAGALATAGYGTALGVIRAVHEQGRQIHVFADETRPYLQGSRLTAWELIRDGIPTTLLCDNMAGALMRDKKIDAVIVGADRIAHNGDVANKIGTYSLAILAQYHKIPFLVAAPLSTIDRKTAKGMDIPIEFRPADEITTCRSLPIAPEKATAYNPAFDVTPAHLVGAIISEKGVIFNPDRHKIDQLFKTHPPKKNKK